MRKILLALALGFGSLAYGQQMPQFSQYLRNQYMVNPGSAGMYDFVDVTLGGRMQWLGFDNAPMTAYVYASSALSKKPKVRYNPSLRISSGPVRNPEIKTGKLKHALGGMLLFDQYGAYQQMKIAGTYALHIPVSQNYNLSFGANIGMSNRSFLTERAQTLNMITGIGSDPTYDAYAANSNLFTMDLGAGLYFYSENMFVGVAAEQLTRDFISFGSGTANFDPNMHYNLTAGWKFPISQDMTLMPAVLVKYMTPAPVSIEGSLQLEYKEWLWFGASYRNTDAVVVMAGLNVSDKFKFGYSFDFSVSKFNKHSSGGHEIVLGLMFGR
jgi:type IX secretion system PorP/SprF family membrane protein